MHARFYTVQKHGEYLRYMITVKPEKENKSYS